MKNIRDAVARAEGKVIDKLNKLVGFLGGIKTGIEWRIEEGEV